MASMKLSRGAVGARICAAVVRAVEASARGDYAATMCHLSEAESALLGWRNAMIAAAPEGRRTPVKLARC